MTDQSQTETPTEPVATKTCGCEAGAEIVPGLGCTAYRNSEWYDQDVSHEIMMRSGGLGFGVALDADAATMSMHLQANGLSHEEAVALGF